MLLSIHPDTPEERKIRQIVACLRNGGIIIYPTDTVYGIGCDIGNVRAVEKVCRIRGIDPEKALLSFVCHDLSHLSQYTLPFDRATYKLMNRLLPGPYTFILKASNEVPKLLKFKRKTVGIRVPDNAIARAIVRELGNPLLSISLRATVADADDVTDYVTYPDEIFEQYQYEVDMVIDGGTGDNDPSTVVDCTGDTPVLVRRGKGAETLEELLGE